MLYCYDTATKISFVITAFQVKIWWGVILERLYFAHCTSYITSSSSSLSSSSSSLLLLLSKLGML
jgi:hypothetical protein